MSDWVNECMLGCLCIVMSVFIPFDSGLFALFLHSLYRIRAHTRMHKPQHTHSHTHKHTHNDAILFTVESKCFHNTQSVVARTCILSWLLHHMIEFSSFFLCNLHTRRTLTYNQIFMKRMFVSVPFFYFLYFASFLFVQHVIMVLNRWQSTIFFHLASMSFSFYMRWNNRLQERTNEGKSNQHVEQP